MHVIDHKRSVSNQLPLKEGVNREKLEKFFSWVSGDITAYTDTCVKILITVGAMSFSVQVSEEGEVKVFEGKGKGEIEIVGDEDVMADLFSSSTLEEFVNKMRQYIMRGKKPKLKILMERTNENLKNFIRNYYPFLLKMYIIR